MPGWACRARVTDANVATPASAGRGLAARDELTLAAWLTYARAAEAAVSGTASSDAAHQGVTIDAARTDSLVSVRPRSDVGREEASTYAVSFPTNTSMNGRAALMADHSAGTAPA